ncbi:hypothetical protein SASPL_100489 [Salvia splendens]|uniref:Uncharacterized protein n=1 Tax=Salvia splendens TaxID=180675 RepID=A0A8X8YMH0_SALSN|nr:hypothetical protein SASPL_100489 [Salvia splendens]
MSSVKRLGQAATESSEDAGDIDIDMIAYGWWNVLLTLRLAKGKAVDDGESSGKQTRLSGKPSTFVVGVPKTAVSFMLPNGVEVVVDAKDVELIFGFPNGGITFDRRDRNTGIKYLETIPLDEEADINAMQTKALYVDRVVHRSRCVPRAIPRIKDWTAKLLKERDEEEMKEDDFGLGRVTSQLDGNELGGRLDWMKKTLTPVESMTQSQFAHYSTTEDWSESLKSLLDAADEMDIIENKDEYPSFSLGFDSSQDDEACHRDSERQQETDNTTNVVEDGDKENAADLGGDSLDFSTGSDIGKEVGVKEPVAIAQVGTVVNEENALNVASAIARDIVSEVLDVAVCSAVEAVIELGDAAFETQIVTGGVDAGKLPVRRDAEMNREESTYAEIQPAPARKLRLSTGRREGSTSTLSDLNNLWLKSKDRVIYSDDVVEVTKLKFSSLNPHEAVDAEVIDSDNVVERRASWEKSEVASTFCDEIDGQFNDTGTFDITQYDLTGVADVLDHVVSENSIPDRAKYGRDLDLLRDYLGFYLKSKGFDKLSDFIIKERSTRLLDLPWKTTQATNDSGVFMMRHMETYMGNPANLMTMGLQGVSVRLLQILRGRYCKAMLLAPFNDCRERFSSYISHCINVTPNFRTDYARQVNGMLNMAPRNEQHNQPTRKKSKLN